MPRSLIVLPDDTAAPLLEPIDRAARTLRIKMFAFSHPRLLKVVIAAKRRGVAVRVMLNAARRNGVHDNDRTRQALEQAGIEVKDANPVFDLTHEKSMVVDDELAVVNSLNWTKRNLTKTRDYAVLTTRSHDVDEIGECFDADWRRQDFVPRSRSHLIWCPGFARDRICQFIDDARHRLLIQNERFQDMVIVERLIRARQRGVKVSIMARPPHTLKRDKLVEGVGGLRILDDVGIRIRSIRHVKLHGKILLADRTAAIVGSINFAAGTFDGRRELAIEVRDAAVVDRLHKVARRDWTHGHPLDLSAEGLMADLEARVEGAAQLLALGGKGA